MKWRMGKELWLKGRRYGGEQGEEGGWGGGVESEGGVGEY